MQKQVCKKTLSSNSVQILEAPSRELLVQIARFQDDEADWNSTVFDLSTTDATFAVVKDKSEGLLGVATINDLSPESYWLGNVVVAKRARRCGVGAKMVSALLTCAETRKKRASVVLISSELGKGIYHRLGFDVVENITVTLFVRPAVVPPARSSLMPYLPNDQEHEAAIKLDQETHGVFRGPMLRAIFEEHGMCAILKSGTSVVATAWGRYMARPTKSHQPELHIGPVVAKSPDFAVSVTAELLGMDHAANSAERDTAADSLVLGVQHGNNETSNLAFKSLGFIESGELPYMRKLIRPSSDYSQSKLDLVRANAYCYAMAWWDIA